MKILHLRSSSGMYGAEGVIINLTAGAQAAGHKAVILSLLNTHNPHTELVDRACAQGLNARSISCRSLLDPQTISGIRKIIKEEKFDVLHCHDYKADFYGLLASAGLEINKVATNHLWTKEGVKLRLYESLDGYLMNFFDRVVAVSRPVFDETHPYVWGNKNKLSVIHNGIDVAALSAPVNPEYLYSELNIPPGFSVVGACGRLNEQKGFEFFLDAAKLVLTKKPECVFLIAGEGPLRSKLEAQILNTKLGEAVRLLGARRDMPALFRLMDVFVLSSVREGLPLVLLEAMASRKAIVATKVGGVPDAIKDRQNGVLLEPSRADLLADGILELLRNKEKAAQLAQNALDTVRQGFSLPAMVDSYLKVYKK